MKVSYDEESDAAYIQLADSIGIGGVKRTESGDPEQTYSVNLDYDRDDRLVGIEVLDASKRLPDGFLKRFANRGIDPS